MASQPLTKKVLLIGIDGADWNLIHPLLEDGQSLPAFRHLVENGTMGNLATLWPTISPILWNSIATGKRAHKHGITGFTEVEPNTRQVQPVSSLSRKCKALWHILQQSGHRTHMINWFASHPAEPLNGVCLSDFFPNPSNPDPDAPWPLPDACVHPADRRDHYEPMRIHPNELDASVGQLFVNDLENLDQKEDQRLYQLSSELARAYTVQTSTLDILDNEEWNFCAIYYRTIDILCHLFMPFHPPKMEGVPDDLFAHYKDAVTGAYKLTDLMLTHLITRAGKDATVFIVSDHGFLHNHLRPAFDLKNPFANAEGWHRDQGLLLAHGPGIRKDHLIHGATLLDVAPTILTLLGQPVGKDMDGRVLTEMLEEGANIQYIDSWETIPGDTGQHPPNKRLDQLDAKVLLDQFAALGYIAPLGEDAEANARQTETQNHWNLARDYLDFGDWESALPLLEELHHENPAWKEAGVRLAHAQFQLGLFEEASRSLGNILHQTGEGPLLNLLLGHLAVEKKNDAEAIEHYQKAAEQVSDTREIHLALGRAYLRLDRPDDARAMFEKVLEANPETALAFQGLARLAARAADWPQALENATRAVALQHNLPLSHELRGDALAESGDAAGAIAAYEAAALYDNTHVNVLRKLAHLADKDWQPEKARTYAAMAEAAETKTEAPDNRLARLREEIEARRFTREQSMLWDETESADQLQDKLDRHSQQVDETLNPGPGATLEPGQEFLLVSGLPRSGTSLMMQLLTTAGIDALTDDHRAPDDFNPRGYFEWEESKNLPAKPHLIEQGLGKLTKIVSPLLPHLSPQHKYRVIFMTRPIEEVRLSQEKMLADHETANPPGDSLEEILAAHRKQTEAFLANSDRFEVLFVEYPDLIRNPKPVLDQILAFAADHLPAETDPASLLDCIDPTLYRSRVTAEPSAAPES